MPPGIVNALSVSVQKSSKNRLILDLRHLFIDIFKCDDIAVAKEVI